MSAEILRQRYAELLEVKREVEDRLLLGEGLKPSAEYWRLISGHNTKVLDLQTEILLEILEISEMLVTP